MLFRRTSASRTSRRLARYRKHFGYGRRLRAEGLENRCLLSANGGLLDPAFGVDGRVTTNFDLGVPGTYDNAQDVVAYQADGKLVVAGRSEGDMLVARYNVDGSLDASFGDAGAMKISFGNYAEARGVAVDSLDRIIVAGYSIQDGTGYDFAVARLTDAGELDATFSGDGTQTVDFGDSYDVGYDVAVDSLDRVVVAGGRFLGRTSDFAVARLTGAGELDAAFSDDGKQTVDFGSFEDYAYGVAVDSLDRIVVAGYRYQSGWDFAVARLTDSGTLDAAFSGDGKQTVNFGSDDFGYSVAVDSLDRIIVAGQSYQGGSTGYDLAVARLSVAGELDAAFSGDGKQTVDFAGSYDIGYGVAVDSLDRIVVAGQSDHGGTGSDFAMARLTNAGTLDTTFSGDGKQTVDFGGSYDIGYGVAVGSLDRIVVAGRTEQPGTGSDIALARLTTAGALDAAFSGDGKQTTDIGRTSVDIGQDVVAFQADGKLVVAGRSEGDMVVARYNVDGTLDVSFGADGKVRIDFGNPAEARSVAVDSHGRIVVAGYSIQGGTGDFAVARLTVAGDLDAAFSGDGKQTVDFGDSPAIGYGVAVDSLDRIVVAGESLQGDTGWDFAVARLTVAGDLDAAFSGDGKQTVDFGNTFDFGYGVAVDSLDRIVVAGQSYQGGIGDFAVARLTDAGELDAAFSGDGKQTVDFGNNDDYAIGVAIDSLDRIVVAGGSYQGGTGDFAVARLNGAGELDAAFNGDGKQTVDFGSSDDAYGVAVDSLDRIVVAGGSYQGDTGYDFAVARLTVVGELDADFSDDGRQTVDFGNSEDIANAVAVDSLDRVILAGHSRQPGTGYDFALARLTGEDSAPTLDDAEFTVVENAVDETVVGVVAAPGPAGGLTYSIVGGNGASAFAIDAATGEITVADSALLDYETNPVLTLEVQVEDEDGDADLATVTINLLNQASIMGAVFVDVNGNGQYDANEPGIDGVAIRLRDLTGAPVLDAHGAAIVAVTNGGGFYLLEDLDPRAYLLHELQPTGVNDGAELLGSLGGAVVANDTMRLTLGRTNAFDYVYAELGQQLLAGDSASIGFWQNKQGQALIAQGGAALANWLTANFGNVFGNSLAGATGQQVAEFYRDQLFKQQSKKTAGPAKVDAQFMAAAFATYFTSLDLAGHAAQAFGFHVTDTGIGTKVVNVGSSGEAFGVANWTNLTIWQLLKATNQLTDQPNNQAGFAFTYDQNGDGLINSAEAHLRTLANVVFTSINEAGHI